MKKQINKKKIATTSMAVLGIGLIVGGAFAALNDTLTHNETVTIEWVDIVDGSATNLALEDVSDVTNTPVDELTPGITYELTGVLENDSTVPTNWTATDLSTTPGMTVTIADADGADTPSAIGEDIDVSQFGITVQVDQSVTPSTGLNFEIQFSSSDARVMLSEPTAISAVFPDPALAACVANDPESGANGDVNYIISQNELNGFYDLTCNAKGITNLEGLQYITNLSKLSLRENQITNISQIESLSNLTYLDLYSNLIIDISALTELHQLEYIDLTYNDVISVEPLVNLINVKFLYLGHNAITDISSLANLTNLTYLSLYNNNVSDISVVANFSNLVSINLGRTNVTDFSPLANLNNLEALSLYGNNITDITEFAIFTNLTKLELGGNDITDFSSLTYQPEIFMATGQNITLSDTTLGTPTDIIIDGVNGEDLIITWTTPGTYENGQLTWENPGVNSLTFASADGKITGSITQTVN